MDAALPTGKYPAYTTSQLRDMAATASGTEAAVMIAELERRARRDAGDVSVMTPGERLRRHAGER